LASRQRGRVQMRTEQHGGVRQQVASRIV
jgi:hypothetical protein